MNIKTSLLLNLPIRFHNICTIYPLSVADAIRLEDEGMREIFLPFLLSKDVLEEPFLQYPLYEVVLTSPKFYDALLLALTILCRTKNIKINKETLDIIIDDSPECLNSRTFEEFSDIVSAMTCMEKLHKKESSVPRFETPEGYERWKKLQEQRARNTSADTGIQIYDMINCVQFGGNSYIPDQEILKWSYWKLIHAGKTISQLKNYDFTCNAYLQCGDKALIEKHWSELIKL